MESEYDFETNSEISLGTDRWLNLHQYGGDDAIDRVYSVLRRKGYRILATVPTEMSRSALTISYDTPVAFVFGTEKEGLPHLAVELADEAVHLPMYGFVESFNVSVAAALCLHHAALRIRSGTSDWHIPELEQARLFLDWTRQSIPGADAIERRFENAWEGSRE